MMLVTAADKSHFRSLLQFLASVRRFEPSMHTRIYDLGFHPSQSARLSKRYPKVELRKFDFAAYPSHFNIKINAGEYAWKPAIVWECLSDTGSPVCWMDSGNVLIGSLDGIRNELRANGFYSPYSPGTVSEWTHPGMLAYFGLEESWRKSAPNLNGACIAFDPASSKALNLARSWKDGALDKNCIAPQGSSRSNHRQDQALLTVLAYMSDMVDAGDRRYLGYKIHQDVEHHSLRAMARSMKRLIHYHAARIR